MNKVLVFGASGQLGTCLKVVAEAQGFTSIVFPVEGTADILNVEGLMDLFEAELPQYVIHCAAYTNVEKAEEDIMASHINTDGAQNLADLCKAYEATLIHISTDYVFGGDDPKLLDEEDGVSPRNNYGQTKFEGEQSVSTSAERFFIIRTSWLYSEYGNNFVKTMLKLGADRDELKIIVDQVGTPTYGIDLASMILTIINSGNTDYGIYHYSNEGVTSWYDFAKAIFDISGTQVKVLPIPTSEYPTKAVRPTFTVMNKAKIKNTFQVAIPYWRDSLEICLKNLAAK